MNANEEMYRRIVRAVPEGIWVVSPQGQTIFCNERMAELLGTDIESLQRLSCFDPVFPADLEEAQRQFGLQMVGGGQPFEFRMRRVDGSALWVSISCRPIFDDGGACTGLLGLFTDISERRRAEAALRDSEQRFRVTFSQAAVGIAETGLDGKWLRINDRLCEILGYSSTELRGMNFLDNTHPDDRETALTAIRRLITDEISWWSREKRYIRKDGVTVWGRLFTSLVRDQNNQPLYFISVIEDITDRVQAERALQDSEERFRATFFQAAVGIAQNSPQGEWLLLNDRLCEILGYTQAELRGKTFLDIVHPDDRAASMVALRQLLAGEISSWSMEKRYIHKNGATIGARVYTSLVRDQHHLPLYFISVIEDITDRIQAERALRDTEQRLTLAQNAAHLGVWNADLRTCIIMGSGEYASLYGLSPDHLQLTYEEWLKLIHPDDRERVRGLTRYTVGQRHVWDVEFRVVWPDGSVHWLLGKGTVFRDDSGRPVRITGVNLDITERKRAEAAVRESEERFRRVFEDGPLGLALVGKNYHFEKVNGALCQMVGYSEAELLERSFVDITHPDDVQADMELAERLFRREIPFYKLRKRYVKKNGEIIWINLTASLIRDKDGNPIYGLAMVEDITEVKRTEEEALARQKLESLGVLAGGIAHDFNNLLGGILASTELALTEHAEGSAVEEQLQRIRIASIRGAEIVRQLMIYGGKESPVFEAVDISMLVNEMLQLLQVSISKDAVLQMEFGQDLPPAHASPTQIRQVVMNLVTNASEAIGERPGTIRVTTTKVKVGPDSTAPGGANLPEGDYMRLEVSDTGSGMTPEVQARIFDPFFTTKHAGHGLGLAAVQGIIRSHGGTISVESSSGQGTRFEILLPCFDQAVRETKDITVTTSAREPGSVAGTVLVVEDEEILRLAVSQMLRKAGFSVIEAGDGTTGANLFRANEGKIDVVLLDVTLPGMSGREVLEELRRIQPGVKVILTSAFSQDKALSSIGDQHPSGYVRKPYQLSELTSLLRKACLDRPKLRGNAAG